MGNDAIAIGHHKFYTSPIITIYVGSDQPDVFHVHESALRKSSIFFQKALDTRWEEGQTREIKLPEDRPLVFGTYQAWLYGKDLELSLIDAPNIDYWLGFDLYSFGDKIQDDIFCNAVIRMVCRAMDTLIAKTNMRYYPTVAVVNHLYENTSTDSPARKLMVEVYVNETGDKWSIFQKGQTIHGEFAQDLIRAFVQRKKVSNLNFAPRCTEWFKKKIGE